jgi:uncharacterized protein YggE
MRRVKGIGSLEIFEMTKPRAPLAALAIMVFALSAMATPSKAAPEEKPGTISVTGEGVAKKAPDMAIITLTVLREGETARAALDANNSAMGSILSAMEADGIAERDLQTSGYSIQPRYSTPAENEKEQKAPEIVGYEVSNTLSVRVHDLSKVGDILDQAVSLGVNQGGNIYFTNEDPDQAMTEARKAAMADAIAKAKALTEAAGVGLGPIKEITEQSQPPRPIPMMRASVAKEYAAADSVPIATGENEFHVMVNVTWEIAQ